MREDIKLPPRQHWLKNRVIDCIGELNRCKNIADWDEYKKRAKILAAELMYAVTEWDKYYELLH